MKTCLIAALSLALMACAAAGPKIDPAQLSEIQKGRTTVAEVTRRFGIPSLLSKNPDGTQSAMYLRGDGQPGATTIVPLIAIAARDSVTFYFDSRGVLTDVKTTQANASNTAPADSNKATQASSERPTSANAIKSVPASADKPAPGSADKGSGGYTNTLSIPGWLPDASMRNR